MYYVMMIHNDKLYIANEEVVQLQRLLEEAYQRRKNILINRNMFSWWDWLWDTVGFYTPSKI